MAQILEYIKMALANIKANKGRSVLTMLGIIIGIASVITIVGVGGGFESAMVGQFEVLFSNQISFTCGDDAYKYKEYLTSEDMDVIESLPNVTGVSPYFTEMATLISPKGNFEATISGGAPPEMEIDSMELVHGRYYNENDISNGNLVCVLSSVDARKLFGSDEVVGMNVELDLNGVSRELRIVGIVRPKQVGNMADESEEDQAEELPCARLPYTALENFEWKSTTEITDFYVTTEENVDSKAIGDEILALLNRRHHTDSDKYYKFRDFNLQLEEVSSMMDMITAFISLVAGISLLVGGIGVMNIMLVSVTERTREIGIRKSLGASTGSILLQFLAESAIIACIGGIIGIVLGVLLAYLICSTPDLQCAPGITLSSVLFATLFSSGIGIFFGLYPAGKAAKMNPIDALRRD